MYAGLSLHSRGVGLISVPPRYNSEGWYEQGFARKRHWRKGLWFWPSWFVARRSILLSYGRTVHCLLSTAYRSKLYINDTVNRRSPMTALFCAGFSEPRVERCTYEGQHDGDRAFRADQGPRAPKLLRPKKIPLRHAACRRRFEQKVPQHSERQRIQGHGRALSLRTG